MISPPAPRALAVGLVAGLGLLSAAGCQDYDLNSQDGIYVPKPDIVVDPGSLTYDQAAEGQTQIQTLTISNQGDAGLDIESIAIEGSSAFTLLTTGFPVELGEDESIEVEIAFSPFNDLDEADAIITSDDPDEGELAVPLTGTWAVPRLQITPGEHDFGSLPVLCSDSIEVTLSNIGTGTLVVDQIVQTGEGYNLSGEPSLPLELTEGESTSMNLSWTPLVAGSDDGVLYVDSNDPVGVSQAVFSGLGTNDGVCLPVAEGELVPLELDFPVEYRVGDVAFVLDTTSSMSGLAQAVASEFATIAGDLADRVPDITFGLATYEDYRYSDMGSGSDRPFRLNQQQTSDLAAVQNALDKISIHNGSDETESTMEALFQAATGQGYDQGCDGTYTSNTDVKPFIAGPSDAFGGSESGTYDAGVEGTGELGGMGFREDVLPIVIYATDAPLRDPDAGYRVPYGCLGDAGQSDVVSAMGALKAKLIGVGVQFNTASARYQQMVDLANATGSTGDMDGDGSSEPAVVTWTGSSADFREAVVDAVEGLVGEGHFDEVRLVVTSDEFGMVESITPEYYTDVDAGDNVSFSIEFYGGIAEGETEQTVPVEFELVADGEIILDSFTVHVLVPAA